MMTYSDDRPGLTRRQSLAAAGIASAGLIVAPVLGFPEIGVAPALAAALTLTPEQEQGPYYVALDKVRSDIVDGQAGVPLRFEVTVVNATTRKAIKGAAVDLWQCSPLGIYSR